MKKNLKIIIHYFIITIAIFAGFYIFNYFGLSKAAETQPIAWIILFFLYTAIIACTDTLLHKYFNLE